MPKVAIGQPGAAEMKKNVTDAGRLDTLLGGHLYEVPEVYELASPITHVQPGCPPTLLIQGTLDIIQPAAATRGLQRRLIECGVPAVNILYPLTNHAFDLLLPPISPPAHAALYYVERFLALMVLPVEWQSETLPQPNPERTRLTIGEGTPTLEKIPFHPSG